MIHKRKPVKIRTQLSCLILIAGTIAFILFHILWYNKWTVFELFDPVLHLTPPHGDAYFFDTILEEAVNYDIPASEKDTEAIESLQPFFDLCDEYTSLYIYGLDGIYRAGRYAPIMNDNSFRSVFDLGYRITGGEGEGHREFSVEFKNGTALVMVYFYHNSLFLYPYAIFCIASSFLFFLSVILIYISRKLKQITKVQNGILQMASGDLKTVIPQFGHDEIGILSMELDKLRITLDDTLRQEQESRQANQDLITAMSHDLRTPLTILNGYLEVLKLKKAPDMQEEYLDRCLQKTKDIKDMTDRMFEYALVFEEAEIPNLVLLPLSFYQNCLLENTDFIRLAGFSCDIELSPENTETSLSFLGDETMLKRIFNNLFSNILKYGDKSQAVLIRLTVDGSELKLLLKNRTKEEVNGIESNHIGLKSVEKMMSLLGGRMLFNEMGHEFSVQLTFPSS